MSVSLTVATGAVSSSASESLQPMNVQNWGPLHAVEQRLPPDNPKPSHTSNAIPRRTPSSVRDIWGRQGEF
jgi:hypothetical protein